MHLLTYTPPLERVLRQPIHNTQSGEEVDWTGPLIFRVHARYLDPLPWQFHPLGMVPCIQVCTAPDSIYENFELMDRELRDYESEFVFFDRESFKAAYSAARAIQNGRKFSPDMEFSFAALSTFHAWMCERHLDLVYASQRKSEVAA